MFCAVLAIGSAAQGQEDAPFDHFMTRFPLTQSHERASCDSCHRDGQFRGTPMRCAECHDGTGRRAVTSMPPNHIPVRADCADCHTTLHWAAVRMDHSTVTDRCESCHMGGMASGKPPNHFASSNNCSDCHRTFTWANARFDHGLVAGNCVSCHNGFTATGKNATHVQSSNDCEACHSTRFWIPASGFDHSNVTAACDSCHNGVTATGKDPAHVQSSNDCSLCHSTNAWLPANFDHASVTGSCSSCHNGVTASGTPPVHFTSSLDCSECHNTNLFTNVVYRHTGGGYPGDHAANPLCQQCHQTNSQTATWSHPSYQPDCAGCHANDFKIGPHKKHENPDVQYTVSELRDCSGSCHVYTDATLTTIKERKNQEHRVSDGDF